MLYCEPLGLILLVLASLSSSFLIDPLQTLFKLPGTRPTPPLIISLGIIGSFLCVVERPMKAPPEPGEQLAVEPEEAEKASSVNAEEIKVEIELNSENRWIRIRRKVVELFKLLRLAFPFSILAITYALFFVIQLYFSDECRTNAWGYNSIDQVLLPFYVYPYLFIVDLVPCFKKIIESENDRKETFWQAVKATWYEAKYFGFVNLFIYRGFVNARAMLYSYLTVMYNLNVVYLELTLIRVVLSWIGSLFLILIVPRFIHTDRDERATFLYPINLILKTFGSAAIVAALLLLNNT